MGRARAEVEVAALAGEAEAVWYDTDLWPVFVDGLAQVAAVEGDWPRSGAVQWDAKLDGRGRVHERVVAYEARAGQTLAVEDEKLSGTQRIDFHPLPQGCRVVLSLEYRLKMSPPAALAIDFFTRRPIRDSLQRTLKRFRLEVETGGL